MPSTQQHAAQSPGGRRDREKRRRGRRFRWTRRLVFFCGWLVLMLVCLAGLFAALAFVAYKNATPIANLALEQFAPDYPIEIGRVEFPENGLIEVSDITVDLPEDGRRAGKIGRIQLRYDVSDLRNPRARALRIDNPDFKLDDELLAMFAPQKEPDPDEPPPNLSWVKLDELKVVGGKIDVALRGIPRSSWKVDLDAGDIDLSRGGKHLSSRPQQITLRDIAIEDPGGNIDSPLVKIDQLDATIRLNKDFASGAVATLRLTRPVVRFSPKLIAALQPVEPAQEAPPAAPAAGGSSAAPEMHWSIDEIFLDDGFFAMTDFYDSPDLSFHHTGSFTNLSWSSESGLGWPGRQQATLTEVRVDARALPRPDGEFGDPATPVVATFPKIEIAGRPDEFFESGWIDKIAARKPTIRVNEERVRRFLTAAPEDRMGALLAPATTDLESTPAAADTKPFIIRPREFEIADAEVIVDGDSFLGGLPESTFKMNLRSAEEQPEPEDDVYYLLSVTDLHIHPSDKPDTAMAAGDEILVEFSAAGIQQKQRIDAVTISGLSVEIGREVDELIATLNRSGEETGPDPKPAPKTAGGSEEADDPPEWKIGKLDLDEVRFVLDDFIPGLPYVPLVLDTTLEEVPLSGRSRGDERIQKVELRNLEVAAPYNSLLPVARLNSIWLHFTVPGLFRSEIERIKIVSPEIFIGEPLFWYVDFYKNFANNESADDEESRVAAVVADADPCAGDEASETGGANDKIEAVEDVLKSTEISGWKIKFIEAATGSLIIAPKGYPIGTVPFPFSGETNLSKGEINLDLTVPEGDFVYERIKLELRKLSGNAYFNYPRGQNRNNFVQSFKVPVLLYDDYRADEVWLSVTYNGELIHGEFGGFAYGGYIEGNFNIYITETFTWDLFIGAYNLKLDELTEALAPGSLKLTGGLKKAEVTADGEGLVPRNVLAEFETSGACHMHITHLDGLIESLRETEPVAQANIWDALIDPINRAVSVAGIEAFRHYDFSTGTGNLKLEGRDGSASILLDGPDGKRDLEVKIFDRLQQSGPAEETPE